MMKSGEPWSLPPQTGILGQPCRQGGLFTQKSYGGFLKWVLPPNHPKFDHFSVFATGAISIAPRVQHVAIPLVHCRQHLASRSKRRCLREFPVEQVSSAIGSGAWRLSR